MASDALTTKAPRSSTHSTPPGHAHSSWLDWAIQAATDTQLQCMLKDPQLQPFLRPFKKGPTSTSQPAQLVRRYMLQLTHGCKSRVCSVAFCKNNPRFSALEEDAGAHLDVLAMELARLAVTNSLGGLRPHKESEINFVGIQKRQGRQHRLPLDQVTAFPSYCGSGSKHRGPKPITMGESQACLAELELTLHEHMVLDGTGSPSIAAIQINNHTIKAITHTPTLLRNTLETVFGSPHLLSQSFLQHDSDSTCAWAHACPFGVDVAMAVEFFDTLFGFEQSRGGDNVLVTCLALRRCLAAVDIKVAGLLDKPLGDRVVDHIARILAIASLFLATNFGFDSSDSNSKMSHCVSVHEVRALQLHTAKLMLQITFFATQEAESTQKRPGHMHQEEAVDLGWFAAFARDSWMRREWARWWARVPAAVVKQWIGVLEGDAFDSTQLLRSGITSDHAIATQISQDPVRWVGSLELLRLLSDSNDQLLNFKLDFCTRLNSLAQAQMHVCSNGNCTGDFDLYCQQEDGVWPVEFCSSRILGCFESWPQIWRWMANMRYRSDPDSDHELSMVAFDEHNLFSPLLYPFLYNTERKMWFVTGESYRQMSTRSVYARDRHAGLLQTQKLLNTDLYAESQVRPGTEPEWPLLSLHAREVGDAVNPFFLLDIRRSHLLHDAMSTVSEQLRRTKFVLKARFVLGGELGVDMGGVQKELFAQLVPELVGPQLGLFVFANNNNGGEDFLWPNPASPYMLKDFEMVGVILGIAFYNGIPLDGSVAPLAPLLVSQLAFHSEQPCGWPLSVLMARVGSTFPALVAGLQKLLDWDETQGPVEDVFCRTFDITVPDPLLVWMRRRDAAVLGETLDGYAVDDIGQDTYAKEEVGAGIDKRLGAPYARLPCPVDTDEARGTATFPLVTDGSSIQVTSANRRQYVRRYLEFVGYEHPFAQISALRRGFQLAADGSVYRMMRASELVEQLCHTDLPIEADALMQHAGYADGYTVEHPAAKRFWSIVRSFDQATLRKLLAFVTASERVPFGGYERITFVLQRNGPDTERLPAAITCFGRLLLPEYATKHKMRKKLVTAIENSSGFGLI
ncbi:hypothetical protein BX070DRAFT_224661 [Coemansia spiralis]|nr:hypothetical protein BX070DRAFT_224661 [Coemansia spiralis]